MAPSVVSTLRPAEGRKRPEHAFQTLLAEIDALPDAQTTQVNIDAETAAATVLRLLPALRALRPRIKRELPFFNLARFDKLEQYALAVRHAHQLYLGVRAPNTPLAQRRAELAALRDQLLRAARSLADHGLLDVAPLERCKTAKGYQALAADVSTLVTVFQAHWPEIEHKTPVTRAMLADAASRAVDLVSVLSSRGQAAAVGSDAAARRAKAFTLLVRAYDDARGAVEYLRREEGDAAVIAPSLYRGHGGRGKKREVAE